MKEFLFSEDLLKLSRVNEKDFSRDRNLTFTKIITFIINLSRRSLQLDLYALADFFSDPDSTKQAFSKARKKLASCAFVLLNRKLLQEFYSDNDIKTFKGLRVLAVDGSTMRLPMSKELIDYYGAVYFANIPLARTSIMFDVLSGIALDASLNPYKSGERSYVVDHINNLEKLDASIENKSYSDDLLLFDRGYQSIPLMAFLHQKKKHFLMRVSDAFSTEIAAVIKSGVKDIVITVPVFKKERIIHESLKEAMSKLDPASTLSVRVLTFDLGNDKKEIIVTSLLDQAFYTYDDIFYLYGLRWRVEEGYKFYKCIAEIENFSGKSKVAVEQDFYATIFTCNFCSLLMQEAQDELDLEAAATNKKKQKYAYKINRNILIGVVKGEILGVFCSRRNMDEYCEELKTKIKQNLVPIRPDRVYPRVFIRKRNKVDRRAI